MAKQTHHLDALRTRTARRAITGMALGLPLGAACSLALNLDDTKACTSDDQCVYTTGQGSCEDGFCVPPGEGEESGDTAAATSGTDDGSTTTDPSADGTSTGEDTTTTGPVGCTLNSECNEDQRCSDEGFCVNLLSTECTILEWPDAGRDNVEFLGSIMPTSPPFDELVQPLENAHQLAIEDFNEYTTLQDGQKIAWVGCDSTAGAATAVAAATHLRDNVGVHAIVGPVFSEAVRDVAEQVTVPGGIFVISPTASAPSLSNLDDDNLVWRVTPNDQYQGNAIIDRFLVDLAIDPSTSRVMILYKDDAYGNELLDIIGPPLATAFAGPFQDQIYIHEYAPPQTFANEEDLLAAYGQVLAGALTATGVTSPGAYANPQDHYTHIIILGTSEAQAFVTSYFGLWAQNYFSLNPAIPLPLITLSHGAVPTMEAIVADIGTIPGTEPLVPLRPFLHANMRGTSPNIFDAENFAAFNFRYQVRFNDQEALTSSSLSYDAAMATMFSMVTVPAGEEINGAAIAAGMASLNDPAGTLINFDNNVGVWIQDARNTLAAGGTVDLQGVSGALDWDPATGEIRADVLGWNLLGTDAAPVLNPYCLYLLNPVPATDGLWLNASSGMPPCG